MDQDASKTVTTEDIARAVIGPTTVDTRCEGGISQRKISTGQPLIHALTAALRPCQRSAKFDATRVENARTALATHLAQSGQSSAVIPCLAKAPKLTGTFSAYISVRMAAISKWKNSEHAAMDVTLALA